MKSAKYLAYKRNIGIDTDKSTVRVTMRKGIRAYLHPSHRRYYKNEKKFRYNQLNTTFYSDTMISNRKYLCQNKYVQEFVNNKHFSISYPMWNKFQAKDAPGLLF